MRSIYISLITVMDICNLLDVFRGAFVQRINVIFQLSGVSQNLINLLLQVSRVVMALYTQPME